MVSFLVIIWRNIPIPNNQLELLNENKMQSFQEEVYISNNLDSFTKPKLESLIMKENPI